MEQITAYRLAYTTRDIEIATMAANLTVNTMALVDGEESKENFSFSMQPGKYPGMFELTVQGTLPLVRRFVNGFEIGQHRDIELLKQERREAPVRENIRRYANGFWQLDLPFELSDVETSRSSYITNQGVNRYVTDRRTELVKRTMAAVITEDVVQPRFTLDRNARWDLDHGREWKTWEIKTFDNY